jgi:hypothetical protein
MCASKSEYKTFLVISGFRIEFLIVNICILNKKGCQIVAPGFLVFKGSQNKELSTA